MLSTAFRLPARHGLVAVLAAIALSGLTACGDDDGGGKDGGTSEAGTGGGGRGGRNGGGSGGSGGSPIDPLPAETAGKSCSADGDCAPGMCLDALPGPFATGSIPAPGGYCSGECLTAADCGGQTCLGAITGIPNVAPIRGTCLASCMDDGDCRSGYRCVNALGVPIGTPVDGGTPDPTMLLGGNYCAPLPETDKLDDGIVGKACGQDSDCGDGRCLTMSTTTAYPGGYCTGRCLESSDCGAGGVCATSLVGGVGTCYLSCASDADCDREGYRCRAQGGSMRCVPGAPPLPDNVVGNACSSDEDCGGAAMSCAMRLGQSPAPGNYCTQRCVNATDCGAGGVCVGGFGGGTCYRACTDSADCRDGYSCGPAGLPGSAAMTNICSVSRPADDAGVE